VARGLIPSVTAAKCGTAGHRALGQLDFNRGGSIHRLDFPDEGLSNLPTKAGLAAPVDLGSEEDVGLKDPSVGSEIARVVGWLTDPAEGGASARRRRWSETRKSPNSESSGRGRQQEAEKER